MSYTKYIKITFSAFVLSSGGVSHLALAQTGEAVVNFVGTIQEAGCQIDPSTKDQSIDFGTISGANYKLQSGYVDGSQQPINIKLTNCPSSVSLAKIFILGTASQYSSNNLAIDTGQNAATGLSIRFKDLNSHWVYLNGDNDFGQTLTEGDNILHYTAQLTNYDSQSNWRTVTPGTVNANATYSIEYQ